MKFEDIEHYVHRRIDGVFHRSFVLDLKHFMTLGGIRFRKTLNEVVHYYNNNPSDELYCDIWREIDRLISKSKTNLY